MANIERDIGEQILRGSGLSAAKLGLRFDRVVVAVLGELRSFSDAATSSGAAILVTISAPIRLPAKTVEALKREISALQSAGAPHAGRPVTVPAGKLFVMGDNRDNSADSRFWGFVPLNLVRGRAMVVWWSHGQPEGIRFARFGHLLE